MSFTDYARPGTGTATDATEIHTARFAVHRVDPDIAVITAHGEIDAANAQQFVDYALEQAAGVTRLVLDLTGVEFFGTAGFASLHSLNVRCAGESIDWASVPSAAIVRLLRVCDPDSALPFFDGVDAAMDALQRKEGSGVLLQLIPKAR
jgi:anti-anti-sigma factor